MYGIYQGADNPKVPVVGGDPLVLHDNYDLDPIDEQDASALKHDQAFDALNPKQEGLKGTMSDATTPANTNAVIDSYIILVIYLTVYQYFKL